MYPWLEENAGTDSTSAGLDQKIFWQSLPVTKIKKNSRDENKIFYNPLCLSLNKLSVTSDHVRFLKRSQKKNFKNYCGALTSVLQGL
jgi:hypothetical protein